MATTTELVARAQRAGYIWVDGDIFDIERRIKEGDESGWRGDPTMRLMLNPRTGMFEVWAIDRGGNHYIAASHHECDHTLLVKLRQGDPTRNDVIARVLADNERMQADQRAADAERGRDVAERLAWAVRQDLGHHLGGRRIFHSMRDRKAA